MVEEIITNEFGRITDISGRLGVIIKFKEIPFKPSPIEKSQIVREFGGDIKRYHDFINCVSAFIPEEFIEELKKSPYIEYVELDELMTILTQEIPWGISKINAPKVHPTNKGKGIKIGVIDTGIDYNHPDLDLNYKGGYNFINDNNDPKDDNGHGTHVSGIIAALDNDIGVIGVAPEASIYMLKVFNKDGIGTTSDIEAAIEWCINNNMKIMNLSGGGGSTTSLKAACDKAWNAGLVFCSAAGNADKLRITEECPFSPGSGNVTSPAKYDSVIAVGATDINDLLASFSSRGPEVEVTAPGKDILSTVPTYTCKFCDPSGYKILSGTSMATPHATGVCALILAANPNLNNTQIRECLGSTSVDLGTPGRDGCFGRGRIDAYAAVICKPECIIPMIKLTI